MKKTIIAFLCLAPMLCAAQERYVIKGKIGELNAPAKVYVNHWTPGERMDSVAIADGRFTFESTVSNPMPVRLIVDRTGEGMVAAYRSGETYILYVEPGVVEFSTPSPLSEIVFIDSPVNDAYAAYLEYVGGQIQDLAARMNARIMAATDEQRRDPAFMEVINKEYYGLLAERSQRQVEFARLNPHSYFALVSLSEASSANHKELLVMEPVFLAIDESIRNTPDGRAMAQRFVAAKTIGIGKVAPDFEQRTPDGRAVKLSDYRGKYVLLDFWASWCGPCRAESPYLTKALKNYADRNFDVLGVSLDDESKRDAWIQAIADDGLTWTNISDLRGWSNETATLYGIRAIPQNYLLDPDGVIIAVNLRGDALGEFLAELFKN